MRMIVMLGLLGLAAAACGPAAGQADDAPGTVRVVTSFYPLQYLAGRIGGDAVTVTNLTRPGAEPHDLELTPQDVATLADADLVLYLGGFQPAVDEAARQQAADSSYDVSGAARLVQAGDTGAEGSGTDPHFWLDPTRLAEVGRAVADQLAEVTPSAADEVRANAAALAADLDRLDRELETGLASCRSRDLVTTHAAFGYLADRYGLVQRPVSGLSPEHEVSPKDLARVVDFVESNDVRTVYSEVLVDPAAAETIARETGAGTAVLDPIEGLDSSAGAHDYLEVMRANLSTLREGQGCS